MDKIIAEFRRYRDQYGLNQIECGEDGFGKTTQNGTLFTTQYIICLVNNLNKADSISSYKNNNAVNNEIQRVISVFKSCEVFDGVSVRYPNDKEFDSMDNNAALLVFSKLFDNGRYAMAMRNHGKNVKCIGYDKTQQEDRNKQFYPIASILSLGSPKNYWNNNTPELFCLFGWYGRSPGFMGLIDICATGKTSWFRHISLLIGQFLGSGDKANNTDARTMTYLVWHVLKDMSFIHKLLYKWWVKRLLKVYPNGMSDVYNIYYNSSGNNPHPIIKYSNNIL